MGKFSVRGQPFGVESPPFLFFVAFVSSVLFKMLLEYLLSSSFTSSTDGSGYLVIILVGRHSVYRRGVEMGLFVLFVGYSLSSSATSSIEG